MAPENEYSDDLNSKHGSLGCNKIALKPHDQISNRANTNHRCQKCIPLPQWSALAI